MKKQFLLASIILFVTIVSQAQWQQDLRLTNDPGNSYTSWNNAWCIAASGDSVHVVWRDNRDGNNEIYYKRSVDGGVNWGTDTRLTNNPSPSGYPTVAVSGQVVYVVWEDDRDGNYEIYYKRSTNGGVSWGGDTRLTNNTATSERPSASVSDSVVHVVWLDQRDGNLEIYYKRSTDEGVSWGADTRLTNNTAMSERPSVAVSGQVVHVAWSDTRDGNNEIYYKQSTDGGVSWGADIRLTNDPDGSYNSPISASGSFVHVVWEEWRDGNPEIYYKRSTDVGVSWSADVRLTNNTGYSTSPSISVSGQVVHVGWYDNRDGNNEIYYKRSTDGGISWGTDTRLTNDPASSFDLSVSVSGQVVHVVWTDFRDGNAEIFYKRDPIGNPVGIHESFLNEITLQFSPNPFSNSTTISFSLHHSQNITLKIFDVNGRLVATIADKVFKNEKNEISWDAGEVNAGIYFLQFLTAENMHTEKLIVTK
jgi:hypothetical protein